MSLSDIRRRLNSLRESPESRYERWRSAPPIVKFFTWPDRVPISKFPAFVLWLFIRSRDGSDS